MELPPYTIGFYQNENYYPLGSYLVFLCYRPHDMHGIRDESSGDIEYHILFKGDIEGVECDAHCYSGTTALFDADDKSPRLTAEYQQKLLKIWLYDQVMRVLNIKANALWSSHKTALTMPPPSLKECTLEFTEVMDLYTFNNESYNAIQKIRNLTKISQFSSELRRTLRSDDVFRIDHRSTD